jgi:Fur family ferric uptake transcriptional regulator
LTPEIEWALKGGGYRLTAQRRIVARELERSRRPLSAEQLHDRIKREYPQVSLSTVYRALKLLERVGVAHRKSFGEGYSRYDLLRAGKPRHHALCLSCGTVIEFHEALLDYLALRLEREMGFFANFHELTLYGYCAACAAHEPTAARQAAPTNSPTTKAPKSHRRPHPGTPNGRDDEIMQLV